MIVFKKSKVGVSKSFALQAARYRRNARAMSPSYSFTHEDLLQQYQWESTGQGEKPDKRKNGFAYGKWIVDINTAGMLEGLNDGDFCKYEFLNTAILRLHNSKVLENFIPAKPFFAFEDYKYEPKQASQGFISKHTYDIPVSTAFSKLADKAKQEAMAAIDELRSGHVQHKDVTPLAIREMCPSFGKDVVWSKTPIKVRVFGNLDEI